MVTPSLEGWPTKAKEAPSPHEVRMSLLDTNPVFQSLGGNLKTCKVKSLKKTLTELFLVNLQAFPQLFKSFEFGNGSRMSDKNLTILEFIYLQNKKW